METILSLFGNVVIAFIVLFILFVLFIAFLITRFLKKVEPGKALIIVSPRKMNVFFTGAMVFPVIHRAEIMDISTKTIIVERRGKDGLVCKDNIRADISVNFYLRVNPTKEDVTQVAQSIGVSRASTEETLNELFQAKFSEALKTVGKQLEFEDLFQERTTFKERIIETIGQNLNGYSLEDTAIDYLEQTPLEHLDENNILDSEGIRKITEITLTKKEIVEKRTTETRERILELERQRMEAEAKQKSEISIIQSKEEAEALKVKEEERLKSENARITSDEQIGIAEVNKQRMIEVAEKNKERELAVENERVDKDRSLEQTEKEKLVALATIEKDRVVEEEKKSIADIVRQRVAVERSVAIEEEETLNTRAFSDAERQKKVAITLAEKDAESQFLQEIKSAEAKERSAMHLAKEKEITAKVDMETSSKFAESKETLAKGIIAEESAKGLALVKVQEAEANAIIKKGEADAKALEYKLLVEAKGIQEKGKSEADTLSLKYNAEAKGIEEKANAMKKLDNVGRDHEEFKLRLSLEEKLGMENILLQKEITMAQAEVLAKALQNANIDIVGGESTFFDQITSSIVNGKAMSKYVENNNPLLEIKDAFLAKGEDNLVNRIKSLVSETGISSEAIKNLTVSGLMTKLIAKSKDNQQLKEKIEKIDKVIKAIGIDHMKIENILS
ncbi:MAG: flotillin family protein [Spirochaetes bacterium]|nr:flotillin family protein [Spirochaetota bacterium]